MAPSKLTPLAIRLARARKATGLTQDQAAAYVGVSNATYRRWEQAVNEPSASQLVTIAAALATTTDTLLDGTEPAEGPAGLVQRVVRLERTLERLQESIDALLPSDGRDAPDADADADTGDPTDDADDARDAPSPDA